MQNLFFMFDLGITSLLSLQLTTPLAKQIALLDPQAHPLNRPSLVPAIRPPLAARLLLVDFPSRRAGFRSTISQLFLLVVDPIFFFAMVSTDPLCLERWFLFFHPSLASRRRCPPSFFSVWKSLMLTLWVFLFETRNVVSSFLFAFTPLPYAFNVLFLLFIIVRCYSSSFCRSVFQLAINAPDLVQPLVFEEERTSVSSHLLAFFFFPLR